MKDQERLAKEKNDQISALAQQIADLQSYNKSSIEDEVKRLGLLLTEADCKLKEKDAEIAKLKGEIAAPSSESSRKKAAIYSEALEAQNSELKQKCEDLENERDSLQARLDEVQQDPQKTEEEEKKKAPASTEVQKKMGKELAKVYRDIVNLSKVIGELLKGEEPNMQVLWGMSQEQMEKDKGAYDDGELCPEDLGTLKASIDNIRTNICDYYAEKYSNECNLQ